MIELVIEEFINDDIPKTVLTKIPEGFAVVDVVGLSKKADEFYEQLDLLKENGEQIASRAATRFGFFGIAVGAGLGAVGAYFVTRRMLETKYSKLADDEIAQMREHYQDKVVALEGQQTKPELEALVRDAGYSEEVSSRPPMAVTPPSAVVDAAEAARDEEEEKRPSVAEVIETPEPESQRIFEKDEPQPTEGWDYSSERARRSPLRPYVIHVDEKDQNPAYDQITITYYEADDVVCDEADDVIAVPERENLFGEANLEKFGHGSGDSEKVYIRNDRMETVIELVRSPNSYAEEVHGFEHSDSSYPRHRRRVKFDDE